MGPGFALRRKAVEQLCCELLVLAFVLTAARPGLAQAGSHNDVNNQFQVRVEKLTLENLSGTRLIVGVALAATSGRDLAVDRVVFSNLRINGVPVYAEPLRHRFKLRKGSSVALPEPLRVSIRLHDLGSVSPLREAVAAGSVTLDGAAAVQVPLGALAQLMLLSRHAEVSVDLHQQVPFAVPGGRLGTATLLKLLDLAEAAVKVLD
jgi:hypothetical protein